MISKCPGQDRRNLKVETVLCPYCGYEEEIFSDETKVKCNSCKNFICRVHKADCANWCRYAKLCLPEVELGMPKSERR